MRLEIRKQMIAHRRPDAVGADQRHRELLLARIAAPRHHRQPFRMPGHILELAAQAQVDVGMLVDLGPQRGLQIGAVHHPVG